MELNVLSVEMLGQIAHPAMQVTVSTVSSLTFSMNHLTVFYAKISGSTAPFATVLLVSTALFLTN